MEDQTLYMAKGRLNGSKRNNVKGLLNMLYTPREISEEIGIPIDRIYDVYLPAGCPKYKDRRGHISINGKEFKAWFEETYKKRTLDKNQAYCVSCKKVIEGSNPERKQDGNLIYDLFICPNCEKKVARIIDCKRKKNDQ